MFGQIKLKLKKLLEEKESIEEEIKKWQSTQNKINEIEDEVVTLQKRIISFEFDNEVRIGLRNQIQFLLNQQRDIYWEAQTVKEKLESRKLNFMTFKKQPKFSNERYSFEIAVNNYTELLINLLNQDKRIWWENCIHGDKYLKILAQELQGILERRNQVKLLGEDIITNMIKVLSRDAFRNRYSDVDWSNLMEFKTLYEATQKTKREQVYFF